LLVEGTYYLCGIDAGATCEAIDLPGGDEPVTESPDGRLGAFIRDWNLWVRDLRTGEETQLTTDGAEHHGYATANAGWTHSDRPAPPREPPAGRLGALSRDWNLWVRDLRTGEETQLTTDGAEHHGYATDNAGWTHSDRAILVWSPDSTKIATFRLDQRKVNEM